MRNLIDIITEAAAPILPEVFYHGTYGDARAHAILTTGLTPGQAGNFKGAKQATKGAVYLSANLPYTLDYARGSFSEVTGKDSGYVFAFHGSDLKDFSVDEDALSHFVKMQTSVTYDGSIATAHFDPFRAADGRQDLFELISSFLSSEELALLAIGRPFGKVTAVSKKLQRRLPKQAQLDIIAMDHSHRLAHFGSLMPFKAWRIPPESLRGMIASQEGFEAVAERIL